MNRSLRVLAVDPSVMNKAGYGLVHFEWNSAGKLVKEEWAWGAWEISGMSFTMRCHDLKDHIEHDIGEFDVLVCEWPMFYDNKKGHIAARQGYTVNLAGIAMFIVGWFQLPFKKVFLYTAPDWKGTVKKAVTARKFYRMFGENELNVDHNAIDATMMLVHHCQKEKYTA